MSNNGPHKSPFDLAWERADQSPRIQPVDEDDGGRSPRSVLKDKAPGATWEPEPLPGTVYYPTVPNIQLTQRESQSSFQEASQKKSAFDIAEEKANSPEATEARLLQRQNERSLDRGFDFGR